MKLTPSLSSARWALLAIVFLATACGNNGEAELEEILSFECGPGTMLMDRECVVQPFDCPEGEIPTPQGCFGPDVFCGTGTAYDAASDLCVSTEEITCGAGTVEVDGRCLIENELSCGEGTVLADGECLLRERVCGTSTELEGIQCVAGPSACASGTQFDVVQGRCVNGHHIVCGDDTVVVNNRCRPLHTYLDELAAAADVDFSNSNRTITLGNEVGDQVVFTGTMTPPNNLFHVFPLVGTEGRWVQVTLYARGIPSIGFRARRVYGPWEREVLAGVSNTAQRTFVFPASETYDLIVQSSYSLAQGGPYGDESWGYVGVIEVVEAPPTGSWDIFNEPLSGDLAEATENFVQVQIPQGQEAIITAAMLGSDVGHGTIEIWNSPTSFNRVVNLNADTPATIAPGSASTLYLNFDARRFFGSQTGFAVNARPTVTLQPGEMVTEALSAQPGQVIRLSHINAQARSIEARVLKEGDLLFTNPLLQAQNASWSSWDTPYRDFYVVEEAGTYTVELENTGTASVTGFYSTHSVQSVPHLAITGPDVVTLQTTLPIVSATTGDWSVISIHSADAARLAVTLSASSGYPYVAVYDKDRQVLIQDTTWMTSKSLDFNLPSEGHYALVIKSGDSWTLLNSVSVTIAGYVLETLSVDETISESFTASNFDVLHGTISYGSGSAPSVRLLNPNGAVVFEHESIPNNYTLLELLPGSGEYTLEITNNGAQPTLDFTYSYDVDTPVSYLDRSEELDEVLDSTTALQEGESEFHLLRARSTFSQMAKATVAGDEEVHLRLFNVSKRSLLSQSNGSGEVSVGVPGQEPGLFLVQVEALTDLPTGYGLTWTALNVSQIEYTVADIFIAGTSDWWIGAAHYDAEIVVSSCSTVLGIEVELDFHTNGLWKWDLSIFLTAPDGTNVEVFYDPDIDSNYVKTTPYIFPTQNLPAASFDPLIGSQGNGIWKLDIYYSGFLGEESNMDWTMRLDCPQ